MFINFKHKNKLHPFQISVNLYLFGQIMNVIKTNHGSVIKAVCFARMFFFFKWHDSKKIRCTRKGFSLDKRFAIGAIK